MNTLIIIVKAFRTYKQEQVALYKQVVEGCDS